MSSGIEKKPSPQFQYKDEVSKKAVYSVVNGNGSMPAPQTRYHPTVVGSHNTNDRSASQVEDENWLDLSDELEPIGVAHLPDSDDSRNQRGEGDSDSTQMVSGSKPNVLHDLVSLPSFPEDHGETIDCSWIGENDYDYDPYGYPAEYGGEPEFVHNVGGFSEPIDLTMYG